MIITDSEREYIAAMEQEFGKAFGSNLASETDLGKEWASIKSRLLELKRNRSHPLSDIEKQQILELRKSGVSYASICKQFNTHNMAIWEVQIDAGYGFSTLRGDSRMNGYICDLYHA